MTSDKQRKINRNNRKRGSAFEKRVADFLGFEVVPYSGSNARYGYGDVRSDDWLIECKNIEPKNNKITVKQEWISKNRKRANDVDKSSAIIFMPSGKSVKFVLMECDDMLRLYGELKYDYVYDMMPKVHNVKNLIICLSDNYIKDVKQGMIIKLILHTREDNEYYLMSLQTFKEGLYEC